MSKSYMLFSLALGGLVLVGCNKEETPVPVTVPPATAPSTETTTKPDTKVSELEKVKSEAGEAAAKVKKEAGEAASGIKDKASELGSEIKEKAHESSKPATLPSGDTK